MTKPEPLPAQLTLMPGDGTPAFGWDLNFTSMAEAKAAAIDLMRKTGLTKLMVVESRLVLTLETSTGETP